MPALEGALTDDDPSAAPLAPARAPGRLRHWGTTVGMKVMMAATGIALVVFLVFHLAGNLLVYQPERDRRAARMVERMDAESFGNCSWHGECQEACPKRISIDVIARMNGDHLHAAITWPPGGRYGNE
jgi:hypothetical protein